ncbi:hypothetical protein DBR37_01875 [Herminiimonas sp. KBW02]|uniref:DUF6279 family lipoprotein n=1 Tax=Herminiimonas sp. KBW02 TaxID=2153363 RepID=UPI000F593E05|nr:DUF6279 family lipoprotein [Herminiimonas sp. KBW02]RQO36970.1 hypothetical protein DBR37_01875 [Herminiimonas sp. KBW02]
MQNFITRPLQHFAKKAAIVLMATLLLACSAARLGYSNGETISYWWLDSYVDFDSSQKQWVKERIDKVFVWHRQTQLKEYVRLIDRMRHRDFAAVTQADLLGDYRDVTSQVLEIADKATPDFADLALSLTTEQIANIEKKFAKSNDKFRKEYLVGTTEERQEFRYRKTLQQAQYWFGGFSREQEASIRSLSDARPLNNELLMAERQHRQRALIVLLKKIHAEKPGKEATVAMLRKYVAATMDRYGNQQQQTFFEQLNTANANLVAGIMRMTTPKQKSYFVQTLQDWVNDFNTLAAKAA